MPELGYWDYFAKKGGHMLGYGLLAASYYHALGGIKHSPKWRFIMALTLAVLFAASDEFHQKFTPGRSASPVDVGIDTLGGIIGLVVSHRAGGRKALNSEIQKRDIA
jgi:VanZ family protein